LHVGHASMTSPRPEAPITADRVRLLGTMRLAIAMEAALVDPGRRPMNGPGCGYNRRRGTYNECRCGVRPSGSFTTNAPEAAPMRNAMVPLP
jgi:hypothetical protein